MSDKSISRRDAVINTLLVGSGLLGATSLSAQTNQGDTSSITVVDTFADLAITPAATAGMIVYLKQHTRDSLGGGYFQDVPGTVTNNGGTLINNGITIGRHWKRIGYEYVTPQMFGAIGNNSDNDIDTIAIQAALDSGENIISPPGYIYRTNKTLFLTIDNISADFGGSKIINKSDSPYAIVIVTNNIGEKSQARLYEVINELHYGYEVRNSHIKNLIVEMSAPDEGSNNLGVGIVYGRDCTFSDIDVLMTDGNGLEVRNSTACGVRNSRLKSKAYGAFFFMTKDCYMSDVHISGCQRGIITKHSQSGKSVNFRATRCVVENLTNNLYYTVGGEWKETVESHPIYQQNHELVSDVLYQGCTFKSDYAPMKVELSYWANRFTYSDCTFISLESAAGASIGLSGNQSALDKQGGTHKFIGCNFVNKTTVGDVSIVCGADTIFDGCTFTGAYQRLMIVNDTYKPVVRFTNNLISGSLQKSWTSNNALLVNSQGSIFTVNGNIFKLGLDSESTGSTSALAFDLTAFDNNTVRISGAPSCPHTSVYVNNGSAHNNNMHYSDFSADLYSIYAYGASNIQNNIIGNNDNTGSSSRALYMVSENIEVVKNEGNYIYGTWQYQQYANLPQNYQSNRRIKEWSSIPTTGIWDKGDIVLNVNAAVGAPMGWICVSSGAPGSWAAMQNLI